MKNRKIFITVKTYPTLSKKYDELVCTAGILDNGSWARIYPLPFRKLDYEQRYKKFQWLEMPLKKNESDPRPESYKVDNIKNIRIIGKPVGTKNSWQERKKIILSKNPVYTNLTEIIKKANSENSLSIAIFKPTKIFDLIVEEVEREYKKSSIDTLKAKAQQLSLFQTIEEVEREFSIIPKLPFRFSYSFIDDNEQKSTLMIEDWEIGALFWNCLKRSNNDEQKAIEQVKHKYLTEFNKKDLYLFLGTQRQYHGWAKNPFVIIGVFYPPFSEPSLFDY